jgi:hypothetical protein
VVRQRQDIWLIRATSTSAFKVDAFFEHRPLPIAGNAGNLTVMPKVPQASAVFQSPGRPLPNPSFELTLHSVAHLALISFWAKPATLLRAAQFPR